MKLLSLLSLAVVVGGLELQEAGKASELEAPMRFHDDSPQSRKGAEEFKKHICLLVVASDWGRRAWLRHAHRRGSPDVSCKGWYCSTLRVLVLLQLLEEHISTKKKALQSLQTNRRRQGGALL
jgi:hypothetical protein